jgi:hypothetical protein
MTDDLDDGNQRGGRAQRGGPESRYLKSPWRTPPRASTSRSTDLWLSRVLKPIKGHNELCEQWFRSRVRRSTHPEPGAYQKGGSKDSDITTYVDGRKETDEMRVEVVDI